MIRLKQGIRAGWSAGVAVLVVAGLLVLATSLLSADDEAPVAGGRVDTATDSPGDFGATIGATPTPEFDAGITYPEIKNNAGTTPFDREPDKLPRPDEASAMDMQAAREVLFEAPALKRVIEAVEAGDVEALLAASVARDYCEDPPVHARYGTPPECVDGAPVPARYMEMATMRPTLRPVAGAIGIEFGLTNIFSSQPVQLTLVAREQLDKGHYFLVFKAERPVVWGRSQWDGLGIVVDVENSETPIQRFRFIIPSNNGLEWLQHRAEAEGYPAFDLIAPESLRDWPGMWGELGN